MENRQSTIRVEPSEDLKVHLHDASAGDTVVAAPGTHAGLKNLNVPPGVHLKIPEGATLEAATDMVRSTYESSGDQIFDQQNGNVTISGRGTIDGLRDQQETLPEPNEIPYQGHAIFLRGAKTRKIRNVFVGGGLTIRNPPSGDCIEALYCEDCRFENLTLRNGYRNCLTITNNPVNVTCRDLVAIGAGGTEPEDGIDVEPSQDEPVIDVTLENVTCLRNAQNGLELSNRTLSDTQDWNVVVENLVSRNNGYDGVSCIPHSECAGGSTISNAFLASNGRGGISVGENLRVSEVTFHDNGTETQSNVSGAGLWYLYRWGTSPTNFVAENCYFSPGENQMTPASFYSDVGNFRLKDWFVKTGHVFTNAVLVRGYNGSGPTFDASRLYRGDFSPNLFYLTGGASEQNVTWRE